MYQEFKLTILEITDLSRDAIHIYVGLAVFFTAVALFRRGKIDAAALVPVVVVATLMEIADLYGNYRTMDAMYWGSSVHDILNTLFWPVIIVLLKKAGLMKLSHKK